MSSHDPRSSLRAVTLATLLAAAGLAATLGGCGTDRVAPLAPESAGVQVVRPDAADLARAIRAHDQASPALLERDEVTATSVTVAADGRSAVLVSLARPASGLPGELDGVPVEYEVVGEFRAFALTDSYRPVRIGVSSGNANECIPGTVGAVLEKNGRKYLLCANHVYARMNEAAIGEIITQPARVDESEACDPSAPGSYVARLADYEPLVFDKRTPNLIDAAIAEVLDETKARCATPPGYYGKPSCEPVEACKGLRIQKLGRTTGLTRAKVKSIHASVKISYPAGKALLVDQIMTSKQFGDFGDSGALVVTDDANASPVGIIIGGGGNGSAIVTPMQPILDRFGATICGR